MRRSAASESVAEHGRAAGCLLGLLLAASCMRATPPHRAHGLSEPLPEIRLSLDVRGPVVGLTGADGGPMCDGEISGAVSIRKAGEISHVTVPATKVSEVRCVGCDPVPGDPHSCDHACQRAFRPFIELGGHGASLPGDYALTGEELVLSCAPHRLRIRPLYVSVDAEGNVSGSAEPPAPRQVVVPVPAAPARAPNGATATDIRTLVARLSRPRTDQTEDLLGQAGDPRGAALDVPATLADARARWTAYLAATTTEVDAALAEADQATAGRPYGPERTSHDDGFARAWSSASMTLVV